MPATLPPGFVLDEPQNAPALPEGFVLDEPTAPAPARPGVMEFVNQGVASGVGSLPDAVGSALYGVDIINKALGHAVARPFDLVAEIMGGGEDFFSQNIPDPAPLPRFGDTVNYAMDAVGVPIAPPDVAPEGFGEHVATGVGGAVGGLVPFIGGASALQAGGNTARAAGDAIMAPFANAPARGLAAEIAAGAGAGAGMDVGERVAPGNPITPLVGAFAGGAAGGAGAYGALQAGSRLPLVSLASRTAASQIAPFTEYGALQRGRSRVTGLSEDATAAREAVNTPTIGQLSPAVSSGDRRLMALEQKIRDTDPAIDMRMRGREADSLDILRAAFDEPGQGQDGSGARQFMNEMIEREIENLNQTLDGTFGQPLGVDRVTTAIREGSQPARSSAYDAAYAAPIDYASDAGRSLEALIARVERAAPGTIALANRMMAGEGAQSQHIMANVAPDGTVTFTQMPDTRQIDYITRALNQMARSGDGQGALGGQTDIGRIMGNLAGEIRGALRKANPAYAEALETAATPIGQREALMFGQDLLKPGTARDVAEAQIRGMTGPELAFVRQGVRSQLDETLANVRRTLSTPDVGVGQAQRALRDLSSDAVRQKIGMILPEEEAQAFFEQIDNIAGLMDARRSGPAAIASARPDEEIRAMLQTQNPGAAAAQVMARAAGDETGRTAASVKGALFGHLMREANSGFGDGGTPVLSGRGLRGALNNPAMAAVAREVLTPEEFSRVERIIEELTLLETARRRLPDVGGIMEGEPNSVVSYIARVLAANQGAKLGKGAGSLQTAQMASGKMKHILGSLTFDRAEALLKEAITDRELFDSLLVPPNQLSPRQESRLSEVMTRTAIGAFAGGTAAAGDSDENMEDIIMRGLN